MPSQYRLPGNAVDAYRQFYIAEKRHFARWTKRDIPEWFKETATEMAKINIGKTSHTGCHLTNLIDDNEENNETTNYT